MHLGIYGCLDEVGTVWWYINVIVEEEREEEQEGLIGIQGSISLKHRNIFEENQKYLNLNLNKPWQPHTSDANLRVFYKINFNCILGRIDLRQSFYKDTNEGLTLNYVIN